MYPQDEDVAMTNGRTSASTPEAIHLLCPYSRPYIVYQVRRSVLQRALKRCTDLFLSLLALVILSPLMALVALLIFIDDPKGGPFFVQNRIGYQGKVFSFYKFRTMHVGAEEKLQTLYHQNEVQGKAFKIKNDPRITRMGRFLRNYSIDELPQLLNIIKGDMSIVGPRPPLPNEVAQYDDYERQRLLAIPGLTCFWQVHPDRHGVSFDQWVEMDVRYIAEQSYLLDWKLILQTLRRLSMGDAD